MKIEKDKLKKLLKHKESGKAIGSYVIDETVRSGLTCLEPFCDHGGHPDSAEFCIDRMNLNGENRLEIHLTAYFSEEYQSKVGDAFRKLHKEFLRAIVDLEAGFVELSALPGK